MTTTSDQRMAYPPEWARDELFEEVTRRALELANHHPVSPSVADALRSLEDIRTEGWEQERRGATYKSLSYAARRVGANRQEFIAVAEGLGLTQKHVGHIIARTPEEGQTSNIVPAAPPPQYEESYDDPDEDPFYPSGLDGFEYVRRPEPPKVWALDLPVGPIFAVGERVRHRKFGSGTVTDTDHGKVVVMFEDGVSKILVPGLAPLTKLGDEDHE